MKILIIILFFTIIGCSEEISPPAFKSFSLHEENRFKICFEESFGGKDIMLSLEIKNKDGSVIDRKWHDEYQILYDGKIEGNSTCYDNAFLLFMSAANSTPKEVRSVLHKHKNSMIEEVIFRVASSKNGPYTYSSKVPNEVYVSGIYNAKSSKVRLTRP